MPAKNTIKTYQADSFYHLYNRGVDKRTTFLDDRDYRHFLHCLKLYLTPPHLLPKNIASRLKNYYQDIKLISYVLMPNHFHLTIKQKPSTGINYFMRSLCTKFSGYFNRRYHRQGRLYETAYKAVLIKSDAQLLEVTKYHHRNPIKLPNAQPLSSYPYSSYQYYLSNVHPVWLHPQEILSFFHHSHPSTDYQAFVEEIPPKLIPSLKLD